MASALKIGVRLAGAFEDAGEYLADARALDTAGAHSLWLEGGDSLDPWLMLASIAAVTGRTRLVARLAADDLSLAALETRIITLARLSRGRVGLHVTDHRLIDVATREPRCPVIVEVSGREPVTAAMRSVDGFITSDDAIEMCRKHLAPVLDEREQAERAGSCDLWARVSVPASRAAWRQTLQTCAAGGATGVIVPADPRLVDLLRNPDQEEDRSDLILAQG